MQNRTKRSETRDETDSTKFYELAEDSENNFSDLTTNDGECKSAKEKDFVSMPQAIIEVVKRFLPSSFALFLENSIFFLNILFIGFLKDSVLLSGVGLGGMTANLIVFSIDQGLCGGIDTLVSQAYGGRKYELCNTYLNTCRYVLTLVFIPQAILLILSEPIFLIFGQPPESSEIAWKYIIAILPGMYLNLQFECTRRYLLALGIYLPILYIFIFTFFLHILFLYIFVILIPLSIYGVGIATGITYSFSFLFVEIYTYRQKEEVFRARWKWFNMKMVKIMPIFLKYAVPACLMLLIEWWSFEFLTIYSGWIGINQLAASTVLNNITLIAVEIPYGMALTSTSLVGNSLGSGQPKKLGKTIIISNLKKRYAHATLICGFIAGVSTICFLIKFSKAVIGLYSDDPDEILLLMSVYPLYLAELFATMGYQGTATIVNVVAYWGIMLPMSYVLSMKLHWDFVGIWIGPPIGSFILMVGYITILYYAPWIKISEEAVKSSEE